MQTRLTTVFLLGLASGLPLALTGTTLQAWYTESSVSLLAIGFLSFLGLPYTFKFFWAPVMDHYPFLLRGGRRKGWIISTQLGLSAVLMLMASLSPTTQPVLIGALALFVAFLSASQDIAIDAYRTELLQDDERGLGAAYFVFAYRLAMLASGGLALVMAAFWGWAATYCLMSALMLVLMLPVVFAPCLPSLSAAKPANVWATTRFALTNILQRDNVILLLLFVVFYKLGDALALSLMTNFLLHGLGFSLVDVGLAYKTVSFLGVVLGAMLGGYVLKTWPLYRGLLWFGLAQAFSNLLFVMLAYAGKVMSLMVFSIFIENFCSGMSTAAFFAFLMSVCHRDFAATQFALFSALASIGRVLLGPVAGLMVLHLGWVSFYSWAFLLSFPGLLLLSVLQHEHIIEEVV
jgi:PAT family beta-lactamase induction signal transducer AmpG